MATILRYTLTTAAWETIDPDDWPGLRSNAVPFTMGDQLFYLSEKFAFVYNHELDASGKIILPDPGIPDVRAILNFEWFEEPFQEEIDNEPDGRL